MAEKSQTDMDKSMADMEAAACLPIAVAVAFDFANDLAADNRNKRDQNPDSNKPKDYFADHTNRNSIEGAP